MISIVIPIYNAERFLQNCLDSIVAQTYQDYEVIMIDDGSLDGSAEQCRKYVAEDSRFRFLQQENRGVSEARNLGLSVTKGDFVCFLDSDDVVAPGYLEELLHLFQTVPDCDLSVCDYVTIGAHRKSKLNLKVQTFNAQQARRLLTDTHYFSGHLWNKLFKSELMKDIRFEPCLGFGEDLVFCMQYLMKANLVAYTPRQLYFYTVHQGSTVAKKVGLSRIDILESYVHLMRLVSKTNDPVLKGQISTNLMNHCAGIVTYVAFREPCYIYTALRRVSDILIRLDLSVNDISVGKIVVRKLPAILLVSVVFKIRRFFRSL